MADAGGKPRTYALTSIGRPVDPAWPTNRAVLMLMPVAGVVVAAAAGLRGAGAGEIAWAAFSGVLTMFGAWALARELAPDDNPAAFVSAALAVGVTLLVDSPGLLLVFVALFLARVVNRSVGLPARISDSVIVTALTLFALYRMDSPLLGAVAALAFAFDALLVDGKRRQLAFAAVCLAGAGIYAFSIGIGAFDGSALTGPAGALIAVASLLYVAASVLTRRVDATGDATGEPLSLLRVRAAMLIGLLAAAQTLVYGVSGLRQAALVWAVLAGVGAGGLLRRLLRSR